MDKRLNLHATMRYIIVAIMLTGVALLPHNLLAQWVAPTKVDNTLGPVTPNGSINSAQITYNSNGAQLQVVSVDYINSISGPGFTINDGVNPILTQVLSHATGTNLDIIVGNRSNDPTTFPVAVVYLYLGNIYYDIYQVHNPGGTLSCTYVSTQLVGAGNSARIDIIAEASTPGPIGGLPFCNRFAIAFCSSASAITIHYADLNGVITPASHTITTTSPSSPDIAAIQRSVAGVISDYALVTWISTPVTGNQQVEYDEMKLPAGTTSAIVTLDNHHLYARHPRIDAIDEWNKNNIPGITQWQVAANVLDTFHKRDTLVIPPYDVDTLWQIWGYNNNAPLFICSGSLDDTLPNVEPCVAAGPDQQYAITFYTGDAGATAIGNAATIIVPWPVGTPTSSIYQVNDLSVSNIYHTLPLCNSSSCNDNTHIMVAWAYNNTDLKYKGTANPVVFKSSSSTSVVNVITNSQWQLYPNPATNQLTLKGANEIGDRYIITDIAGRNLQQGLIFSSNQQLMIGSLVPGVYLLNLYQTGNRVALTRFVKQ